MSQPLEPLQQATLTIAGCGLQAVLLPDRQPAVAFAALSEALALDSNGQRQRIQAHPVLTEALVSARLETAGGLQVANVLVAWGIPLWLAGIRLASVKPGSRHLLILFQKEIIAALYQHFFPPTPAPALPEPSPSLSPWQAVHATLTDLEAALEADSHALQEQLTRLEMQVRRAPAIETHSIALERLLAATIARVLEHERRLNQLKRPGLPKPKQSRTSRSTHRRKRRFLAR